MALMPVSPGAGDGGAAASASSFAGANPLKSIGTGATGATGTGSVVPFPKLLPGTASPDQTLSHGGNMGSTLPSSLTNAAAQVPKPEPPVYHGTQINSIEHVGQRLGANVQTDPSTGVTYVNGTGIKPTSISNGLGHAPVRSIAAAAGYPPTHIQNNPDGTIQVMYHAPAMSGQTAATRTPINTTGDIYGNMPFVSPTGGYMAPAASATGPSQALMHTGNMGAPNPAPAPVQPTIPHGVSSAMQIQQGAAAPVQAPSAQPSGTLPPTLSNIGLSAGLNAAGLGNLPAGAMNPPGAMGLGASAGLTAAGMNPNLLNTAGLSTTGGATGTNTPGGTSQGPTQAPAGATGPLNQYWQTVQANKGLWEAPQAGEDMATFVKNLANKFGIQPGQIQVQANGHVFIPWQSLQNYAVQQSNPQGTAQGGTSSAGLNAGSGNPQYDQLLSMFQQYLQGQMSNPYQYQLPQMPQYSFDQGQAAQQAYNAEDPIYQQMMQQQVQALNDKLNARGIYTSGIAQQQENSLRDSILGKESQAINKDMLNYQTNAEKQYTDQLTAWRDQTNAMYQQGQISDAQHQQMITAINDMLTRATSQQNADTTANNDASKLAQDWQKWVTPSGNNTASNDLAWQKWVTQSGNSQASTTFNYYKMLGYVPGPNNTLMPTAQTTKDQLAAAASAAKIFGLGYDPATGEVGPTIGALNAGGTTYDANGNTTSTVGAQAQVEKDLNAIGLGLDPTTNKIVQSVNGQKIALDVSKLNLSQFQAIDKALGQVGKGIDPTTGQIVSSQQATDALRNYNLKVDTTNFDQWLKTSQLKDAESQAAFKEYATRQGILQKWSSLNETAKQNAVRDYQNQEKINNDYNIQQGRLRVAQQNASTNTDRLALDKQKLTSDNLFKSMKLSGVMLDGKGNPITGSDGKPLMTLDAQKLVQTASNQAVAHQLTGLHEQLVAAGNTIRTLQGTAGANGKGTLFSEVDPSSPTKATYGSEATAQYTDVYTKIGQVVSQLGGGTSTTTKNTTKTSGQATAKK